VGREFERILKAKMITTIAGLRASKPKAGEHPKTAQSHSRDNVRDMLVNKMLAKYAKLPGAKTVIPPRITKFMQQNRLTEANLRKLEAEIVQALTAPKPPPAAAAPQPKVERVAKPEHVKSPAAERNETAERPPSQSQPLIQSMKKKNNELEDDEFADEFDDHKPKVSYNEDKEWDSILKFNAALYEEEQKQEAAKRQQQKVYLKAELDKQLAQKKEQHAREEQELGDYVAMQKTHLQFLQNSEKEKEDARKRLKQTERERIEKQLKEEQRRRRTEEQQNRQQEHEIVTRIKHELEEERTSQQQKKELERAYHQKMLAENEENRRQQQEQARQEREQDQAEVEAYAKMLDKQEADKQSNIREREQKIQELSNKLAGSVLKGIEQKRELDDLKMQRYQEAKEQQERMDDEERQRRLKDQQKEMKTYLDKQAQERKEKEMQEKQASVHQASLWQKEHQVHTEQEKQVNARIAQTRQQHAAYLKQQMDSGKKGKRQPMSREEYLMNKDVIEQAERRSNAQTPYNPDT
jgi:hypothetical protein